MVKRSRIHSIINSYGVFFYQKKLDECVDEILEEIEDDEKNSNKSKNPKTKPDSG